MTLPIRSNAVARSPVRSPTLMLMDGGATWTSVTFCAASGRAARTPNPPKAASPRGNMVWRTYVSGADESSEVVKSHLRQRNRGISYTAAPTPYQRRTRDVRAAGFLGDRLGRPRDDGSDDPIRPAALTDAGTDDGRRIVGSDTEAEEASRR